MLILTNCNFSYLEKKVLHNITFSIPKGTNLAIIGESGCGKSTLLKLIYGLHDLDEGSIYWEDNQVQGPKHYLVPGMPFMKYLAQDFDLMPYVTVAENVGKFLSNFFPKEKAKRIEEILEVVSMSAYADIKVKYLSGGQMQRVALARVLALEPELLLLDEPFSHVDNYLKNSLRRKIFKYLKEKEISCIVATHDSNDVLSFADQVLVMKNGEMIDFGKTREIYAYPSSFYAASLFGDVSVVEWGSESLFVYSHQWEINEESGFKVRVKKSYFKGNKFLVESENKGQLVFFESANEILEDTIIGLKMRIDL